MSALAVEFDTDQNTIIYTMPGPVMTAAALVDDYEKVLADDRFRQNMHAIWDISALELTRIPIAEIRSLPRAMKQLMEKRGSDFKAAIVTSRPADQQLLRVYLTILKLIGRMKFRLFASVDEARVWVSETGSDS